MKLDEIEDLTYQLYTYGIGDWLSPGGDETKAIEYGHAVQKLIAVAKAATALRAADFRECIYDEDYKYDAFFEAEDEFNKALADLERE